MNLNILQLTDFHIFADSKKKFFGIPTYETLRDILDNGDNSDDYYKYFGLFAKYKILLTDSFIDYYFEWHKTLKSKKNKSSWETITDPNTSKKKQVAKLDGYVAGNKNDRDDLIKQRLRWLIKCFKENKQDLIDKSILGVVEGMDTIDDVEVNNNFKDNKGRKIDHRKTYHRGHQGSFSKTANNKIDNLVPQDGLENQQYGDKELIK